MSDSKQPTEMDPGARESDVPVMAMPAARNAYAVDTLVAEVTALFPDVTYEFSNTDGRGVSHDVQFVIADEEQHLALGDLLTLLVDPAHNEDSRIMGVERDDDGVLVSFWANARTRDSREPFGLNDAHTVLLDDGTYGLPEGSW